MLIRKMKIYYFITFFVQSATLSELNAGNASSIGQQNPKDAKEEVITFLTRTFPYDLLMEICGYLKDYTLKTIAKNGNITTPAIHCLVPLHDGRLAVNYQSGFKIVDLNDATISPILCANPKASRSSYITCALQLPDGRLVSGGDELSVWRRNKDGSFKNTGDDVVGSWEGKPKYDFRSIVLIGNLLYVVASCDVFTEIFCYDVAADGFKNTLYHGHGPLLIDIQCVKIVEFSNKHVIFGKYKSKDFICCKKEEHIDPFSLIMFPQHVNDFSCLAALRDGRLAASNGSDVTIWNLDDPTHIPKIVKGHKERITCLNGLPNGNLISGSRDSTVRVWDSQHFKELEHVKMPGKISSMAVLSNGKIAVGLSRGGIYIVQLGSSELEEALNNHKKSNKTLTINVAPRSSKTIESLRSITSVQNSAAKSAAGIAIRNSTSAISRIASAGIDTKHSQQLSDAKKTRDAKRALREVKRKEMQLYKAIATSMSENNAESSMQGMAMTEASSSSDYQRVVTHALLENQIPAAAHSIINEYLQ